MQRMIHALEGKINVFSVLSDANGTEVGNTSLGDSEEQTE